MDLLKRHVPVQVAARTTPAAKITYGNEQVERLKVRVSPQYGGTPTGTVKVRSGSSIVCVIRLAPGAGSCRLSPRELGVGLHKLVATYRGSGDFNGSTSARKASLW